MKILVTGLAGFIGSTLTMHLLACGNEVLGIDNHNDYYDAAVKDARLVHFAESLSYSDLRTDMADKTSIEEAFATLKPNTSVKEGVARPVNQHMAIIHP